MSDRYGCNLVVKRGNMEVARFHQKSELLIFLISYLQKELGDRDNRRNGVDIHIEGSEGDFPK